MCWGNHPKYWCTGLGVGSPTLGNPAIVVANSLVNGPCSGPFIETAICRPVLDACVPTLMMLSCWQSKSMRVTFSYKMGGTFLLLLHL